MIDTIESLRAELDEKESEMDAQFYRIKELKDQLAAANDELAQWKSGDTWRDVQAELAAERALTAERLELFKRMQVHREGLSTAAELGLSLIAAKEERDRLRKLCAEAAKMLREHGLSRRGAYIMGIKIGDEFCQSCRFWPHRDGCRLEALIARLEAVSK